MATTGMAVPTGLGKPVPGNTGFANPLNAADGNTGPNKTTSSGVTAGRTFAEPLTYNPVANTTNTGGLVSGAIPINSSGMSVNPSTGGAVSTVPTTGTTGAVVPGQAQSSQLSNQLTDIFGQGVGNLLGSEISNLGSDNSAYLKAFENAQAPINAQNLASLQTTLGNEGISPDSSTAAIAQGDFQSNIASQESYQEQQLQMNDIQNLLNLTQGLQQPAQQEVSSNAWSTYLEPIMNMFAQNAKGIGSLFHL